MSQEKNELTILENNGDGIAGVDVVGPAYTRGPVILDAKTEKELAEIESSIRMFDGYDRSFQEKILLSLFVDPNWGEQIIGVLKPMYFTFKALQYISKKAKDYYDAYKTIPSTHFVKNEISQSLDLENENDRKMFAACKQFFDIADAPFDFRDLPGVKAKCVEFCKKEAFRVAIEQSKILAEAGDYSRITNLFKSASETGVGGFTGIDYFTDIDARLKQELVVKIPTGMPCLDYITKGGLPKGKIGCVLAETGGGKSHFLVHLGASALLEGRNVAYFTFELDENEIARRFDSHFLDVDISDIWSYRNEVKDFCDALKLNSKFFIQYFPKYGATVDSVKGTLESLKLKNFRPDLILVDYASCIRSNLNDYGKKDQQIALVFDELRNLAVEYDVAMWTAAQSNRSATDRKEESLDKGQMAGSYDALNGLDLLITLNKRSNLLAVQKSRLGPDGIDFRYQMDGGKSKFFVYEKTAEDEEAALEMPDDYEDEFSKGKKSKTKKFRDPHSMVKAALTSVSKIKKNVMNKEIESVREKATLIGATPKVAPIRKDDSILTLPSETSGKEIDLDKFEKFANEDEALAYLSSNED